jgi:hypothetical protein
MIVPTTRPRSSSAARVAPKATDTWAVTEAAPTRRLAASSTPAPGEADSRASSPASTAAMSGTSLRRANMSPRGTTRSSPAR